MFRSRQTTRAFLALTLAVWASACYAYKPARLGPTLSEHREVRVRADRPFPLRAPGARDDAAPLCVTREVHGRVVRVMADTIVLDVTSHALEPRSGPDAMPDCPERGLAAVVISPNEHVMYNQIDAPRTLFGLMAFGAIAVLLLSLIASANMGPL